MVPVLDRPPTRPEMPDRRLHVAPVAPPERSTIGGESPSELPQYASVHDDIAALLLAVGEWGALLHTAAWAALLFPLAGHGGAARTTATPAHPH